MFDVFEYGTLQIVFTLFHIQCIEAQRACLLQKITLYRLDIDDYLIDVHFLTAH